MFSCRSVTRALIAGLILAGGSVLAPAYAQVSPPTSEPVRDHFIGLVTNLHGPVTAPDSFTLQLGNLAADMHVDAGTTFAPHSAEAQVEGLVNGDYAVVTARWQKHAWTVRRIAFDVDPIRPLRLVTGTVVRETPDGVHLAVKLPGSRIVSLRLTPDTTYELDSKPVGLTPTLARGESVQALALGPVAYQIDLRTAPAIERAGTGAGAH